VRRTSPFGDAIGLRPEEFRLLRDLFAARTGLHFGPESRFAFERRLRERIVVLKLATFSDYYHHLRFSARAGEEWDEAIDALTTNETYFFREDRQLRGFQEELLPMMYDTARAHRRLSIWSVGCSTGEEAYSIAILVRRSGLFFPSRRNPSTVGAITELDSSSTNGPPEPLTWDVRIYGLDISRRCVAAARRGVYRESSFRATPPEIRKTCFYQGLEGWHVNEEVRQLCYFGQMNLVDDERSRALGRADVIFCRNVLIYFDAHARRTAIEVLYDRLNPGGVLLLGHSESLLNVSTAFELLHLRDDLVYRKPIASRSSPKTTNQAT
jgi:chemotaxis protein methyltransferase CheR